MTSIDSGDPCVTDRLRQAGWQLRAASSIAHASRQRASLCLASNECRAFRYRVRSSERYALSTAMATRRVWSRCCVWPKRRRRDCRNRGQCVPKKRCLCAVIHDPRARPDGTHRPRRHPLECELNFSTGRFLLASKSFFQTKAACSSSMPPGEKFLPHQVEHRAGRNVVQNPVGPRLPAGRTSRSGARRA